MPVAALRLRPVASRFEGNAPVNVIVILILALIAYVFGYFV